MAASMCEGILTREKREGIRVFLSKLHQETRIITAGMSLKSEVFMTAPSNWCAKLVSWQSTRPHDIKKQLFWCQSITRVTTIILRDSKSTVKDQKSDRKYTKRNADFLREKLMDKTDTSVCQNWPRRYSRLSWLGKGGTDNIVPVSCNLQARSLSCHVAWK